jgi:hypothetical protein
MTRSECNAVGYPNIVYNLMEQRQTILHSSSIAYPDRWYLPLHSGNSEYLRRDKLLLSDFTFQAAVEIADFGGHYFTAISSEAQRHLATLPYHRFLRTVYWNLIRQSLFLERGVECELCHSSDFLQIHHRTYIHRGREHEHLGDLLILCARHHTAFHTYFDGHRTLAERLP